LEYLEALRNSEVQDFYLQHDDQRRYYGILPKSVSHEGYYPEPGNHSYWDNFWALRGWKDARMIAEILEKEDVLEWIDREKAELHQAVYTSISNTMDYFNIDYLPGCAELGDFDPSSSAVAITACGELPFLPDDVVRATFERYWRDLNQRFDPGWTGSFSPYEVRIAQAFIMMGWRERANRLLAYLMSVRRPGGWRQWSEAVYVPPRTPGFIGDVPHGWVAAGLLNTVRTMLLYESDETLVVTAGVPPAWLADGRQVRIEEAPTYWGPLSYVLERTREGWRIELTGSAAPPDGFIVVNPLPGPITSATVNGEPATVHDRSRIAIKTLPAILEVEID
jgi:hypothetical protein